MYSLKHYFMQLTYSNPLVASIQEDSYIVLEVPEGDDKMDYKAKLDGLRKELNCTLCYFERKHIMTKHRANIVKISSICFSACITVFLGLNNAIDSSHMLMNVALVLGSLVTIINTVDAFYGFSSLWIKNAVTLARLRELKRKIEFYAAGQEDEYISERELNNFFDEFQKILKDDINQWLRIREKVNSMEKLKETERLPEIQFRNASEKADNIIK